MTNQACAHDEIIITPLFEAKAGQFTGLVGEVKAKGIEIHDVKLGEPVVAGQFSQGARRTTFHFYDYIPLQPAEVCPESALIAHGAAMIHAVDEARLRFGERVLLVGKSFQAELLREIFPVLGIHLRDISTIPVDEFVDAIFVCIQKPLARNMKKALLQLRSGGQVVSITKWGLNSYWNELFKKQLRIFCPNSFGATLRNSNKEPAYQLPAGYVFRTAKKNLADFTEMLRSGKVQLENINTREVIIRDL